MSECTRNRSQGQVKITQKHLDAYMAMRRAFPSSNDAYNVQTFGLTLVQYVAIQRLMDDLGSVVSCAQFNRFLDGAKVQLTRADPRDVRALAKAFGKEV